MANNCLVRAIFHPPTHPLPPGQHRFIIQYYDKIWTLYLTVFEMNTLEFQNFHNILHNVVPISTNLKYITIFNMAACHIFRPSPLKETGNHRLEITETRNYVPEEARGPLFGPGTLTQ